MPDTENTRPTVETTNETTNEMTNQEEQRAQEDVNSAQEDVNSWYAQYLNQTQAISNDMTNAADRAGPNVAEAAAGAVGVIAETQALRNLLGLKATRRAAVTFTADLVKEWNDPAKIGTLETNQIKVKNAQAAIEKAQEALKTASDAAAKEQLQKEIAEQTLIKNKAERVVTFQNSVEDFHAAQKALTPGGKAGVAATDKALANVIKSLDDDTLKALEGQGLKIADDAKSIIRVAQGLSEKDMQKFIKLLATSENNGVIPRFLRATGIENFEKDAKRFANTVVEGGSLNPESRKLLNNVSKSGVVRRLGLQTLPRVAGAVVGAYCVVDAFEGTQYDDSMRTALNNFQKINTQVRTASISDGDKRKVLEWLINSTTDEDKKRQYQEILNNRYDVYSVIKPPKELTALSGVSKKAGELQSRLNSVFSNAMKEAYNNKWFEFHYQSYQKNNENKAGKDEASKQSSDKGKNSPDKEKKDENNNPDDKKASVAPAGGLDEQQMKRLSELRAKKERTPEEEKEFAQLSSVMKTRAEQPMNQLEMNDFGNILNKGGDALTKDENEQGKQYNKRTREVGIEKGVVVPDNVAKHYKSLGIEIPVREGKQQPQNGSGPNANTDQPKGGNAGGGGTVSVRDARGGGGSSGGGAPAGNALNEETDAIPAAIAQAQEESWWSKYKTWILGIGAALLIGVGGYFIFRKQKKKTDKAKKEASALNSQVGELTNQLNELQKQQELQNQQANAQNNGQSDGNAAAGNGGTSGGNTSAGNGGTSSGNTAAGNGGTSSGNTAAGNGGTSGGSTAAGNDGTSGGSTAADTLSDNAMLVPDGSAAIVPSETELTR